jgi:tetratricopeptide (TPR) repeat protein
MPSNFDMSNTNMNKLSPLQKDMQFLQSCIENKLYKDAIKFCSEKLVLSPNENGYKKCLAFCYDMTGELFKSKELWIQLIDDDPFSEETLMNLSSVECKLGNLDSALGLLKLITQYHPDSAKPWISMAGIHLLRNEFDECANVSMEAINKDPKNADGFQNLGSGFFHLALFDEAKHAFETALILQPEMREAQSSLSSVFFRQGRSQEALDLLEKLISTSKVTDRYPLEQLKWSASFIYLRLGNFSKGWEYYEEGMSNNVSGTLLRRPSRTFQVPRWTPNTPADAPVLVWREQGIGDEVIFLTCLQDLIDLGYSVIIECDKRLINIVERSFPGVKAREAIYRLEYPHDSPHNDFGSQIPVGSLMQYFRPSLERFIDRSGFLVPSKHLLSKWNERLKSIHPTKKKIGISWKSGISDPLRNAKYSALLDWDDLLNSNEYEFINLQYGDSLEEIVEVKNKFGVTIHNWDDLNLKADIEDIFALIKNLDHVITISSAVWTFAAASGTPTSLLLHTPHWTMFNEQYTPFFSNVLCHVTSPDEKIHHLLKKTIADIN